MKLKKEKTCHGFVLYKFKDIYDTNCSLQKSSLATKDAIWLGADDLLHYRDGGVEKVDNARMHLDRKMAKKLADKLLEFYYTGEI